MAEESSLSSELKQYQYKETGSLKRFFITEFSLPWNYFEIAEFILYIILGIVNCVVFATRLDDFLILRDTIRYPLLYFFTVASPIASFYAILTFKLKSH